MLADRSYLIGYSARIDHFTPTPPGTYGTGSGEIHIAITPVPEPATCALLLHALFLAPHRLRAERGFPLPDRGRGQASRE